MDFQHTNHRRNKGVFSKSKNSSIKCIAFHFHCTVIKPVDGKDAACTPRNVCVTGLLCLKGQGIWEDELPVTLDWPGNEALESKGKWNTLIIKTDSSFSDHISWPVRTSVMLRVAFCPSRRSWPTSDEHTDAESGNPDNFRGPGCYPEDVKFHSVEEEGWRLVRLSSFLRPTENQRRTDATLGGSGRS